MQFELGAAAVLHPDPVGIEAPAAAFDAGRARKLLVHAHATAGVEGAAIVLLADGLAAHDAPRRPAFRHGDHHAELGSAAAGHPHATRIGAPVLAADAG